MTPPPPLTTRQVCELVGISRQAVGKAVRAGRLAAIIRDYPGGSRDSRLFDPREVARFAASRQQPQAQLVYP